MILTHCDWSVQYHFLHFTIFCLCRSTDRRQSIYSRVVSMFLVDPPSGPELLDGVTVAARASVAGSCKTRSAPRFTQWPGPIVL